MKRRVWRVESLESRHLLSAVAGLKPRVAAVRTPAASFPSDISQGSGITADPSPPRPREVARRAFVARFTGTVRTLPPRLFDEARQFAITAPGTSNQFLHGTLEMRYFTPSSGTQTTGAASLSDRNTSGQAVLLLDMTGNSNDVDSRGRPTRFAFTVNGGGGSNGIYASSVGGGFMTIVYRGNQATVTVRGSVYTSGIGDPLVVYSSAKA